MYFVISKKRLMMLCLPVLIIGIFVGGIFSIAPVLNTFGYRNDRSLAVIVDAGHGEPDGGAVGAGGSVESTLNLKIAQKLKEVLMGKGIDVIMTRNDESGLLDEKTGKWSKTEDMRQRMSIMKDTDAQLFISIHMNHFTQPKVHGLRVFYAKNHAEIKDLAEAVQSKIADITGAKTSTVGAADSGLFLMKSPPVAAMLIECGFLSNPQEEKKLNNEEYQAKIAWAIADAVENYYTEK